MKHIAVMLRVKNEQEYIYQAIKSLDGCVDSITLIDNQSSDNSILLAKNAAKDINVPIKVISYPYEIMKVGSENYALFKKNPTSPKLLSNFYNFSLENTIGDYILKWDGDMIATSLFKVKILQFKKSKFKEILSFRGFNLYDSNHLLDYDEKKFQSFVSKNKSFDYKNFIENWLSSTTTFEQRLFPKKNAYYDNGFWWCERLVIKRSRIVKYLFTIKPKEPLYWHMKLLKKNRFSNMSAEYLELFKSCVKKRKIDTDEPYNR
ncbi:MAG: hypothetical protein JXQ86_04190 [Methylophilaceae bacterium]